jgi:hypothetical protein
VGVKSNSGDEVTLKESSRGRVFRQEVATWVHPDGEVRRPHVPPTRHNSRSLREIPCRHVAGSRYPAWDGTMQPDGVHLTILSDCVTRAVLKCRFYWTAQDARGRTGKKRDSYSTRSIGHCYYVAQTKKLVREGKVGFETGQEEDSSE